MKSNVSLVAVLAVFLAGALTAHAQRDFKDQSLDLLRFLATKPWAGRGHNRWDRAPRFDMDLADRFASKDRWGIKPRILSAMQRVEDDSRNELDQLSNRMDATVSAPLEDLTEESAKNWAGSVKRSAVATALNGRRRRQPAPALGVLNDVGSFFDTLRDNLESIASLSPQQRAVLFSDPPTVVRAPSSGGGGGGTGTRRLHALRPLRPTGNIRWACLTIPKTCRTYNRRSFVETDGVYPGANHHDPGLLWTGLGRR